VTCRICPDQRTSAGTSGAGASDGSGFDRARRNVDRPATASARSSPCAHRAGATVIVTLRQRATPDLPGDRREICGKEERSAWARCSPAPAPTAE
jgi:hypothetical protein